MLPCRPTHRPAEQSRVHPVPRKGEPSSTRANILFFLGARKHLYPLLRPTVIPRRPATVRYIFYDFVYKRHQIAFFAERCVSHVRRSGVGLDDSVASKTAACEDMGGGAVKSRHHDNALLALLQLIQSAAPSPSSSSDPETRRGDIGREAVRGR